MKKTFKEKIIFRFTNMARQHKFLKYPCLALLSFILGIYYIGRHFATNGKRYASVAFVIIFFMNSCSFSFAVFAERTGFINAQEAYSAVVEDSDIALAVEKEVNLENQILLDDDDVDAGYDAAEDIEGVDTYTLDDILENQENYQTDDIPSEDSAEEYVFDSSDWRLVLINKQHPIPEDYEFTLGTIKGSMQCDERIISDLLAMLQAAKVDGVNLAICSPYRDLNRQEVLFNKKIKVYMGQGMSYMEAYKLASQAVTVPGASEHQIGLALDIFCDTYTSLDEGFAETEAGKWLAEHSCEYGFTLRYPSGKEYITSIEYEPWHFRYVGKEAATIMKEEGICLEEFWDKYL
ncbi:MAG: M15 family metallopeptidase [Lachnospiraceae bacterium]|nr:M15 family metallopeptidase [Lachnospiraceae bacterium]